MKDGKDPNHLVVKAYACKRYMPYIFRIFRRVCSINVQSFMHRWLMDYSAPDTIAMSGALSYTIDTSYPESNFNLLTCFVSILYYFNGMLTF